MDPATDLFDAYTRADHLLSEGDLRQAADICKTILDSDPDYPYGYHLMASLFRATGTMHQALSFAQMAVKLAPEVLAFHMQEGQVLLAVEDYDAAILAFQKAHELQPEDFQPLMYWGDCCVHLGMVEMGLELYRRARRLSDHPKLDEHEGLCLLKMGELARAEKCFDRMIQRSPDACEGYLYKGQLMLLQNRLLDAEAWLSKAIKRNPNSWSAFYYLAMLTDFHGQGEIAIRYAAQSIRLNPQHWTGHALLGYLLLFNGHEVSAEEILRQAHGFQPGNIYILQLLMRSLRRQGKLSEALQLVETLLAQYPDRAPLHYFRAMIRSESPDRAPAEYIAALYDGFAELYNHHMRRVVSYRIPEQMADMITGLSFLSGRKKLSMLDLGCGTGLAAAALKDMTGYRVGIDLSEKMLERARATHLYDMLYALDMMECMPGIERTFDLVVAAESLMYMGRLAPFFSAARNVLAVQGVLVFSLETQDGIDTFRLQANGCFVFSVRHVLALAKEEGYELLDQEEIVVRIEQVTPIYGTLFCFRKTQMH